MYSLVYTKRAINDIPKLKEAGLDNKAKALIELLKDNPFKSPPPFEKLKGDLQGAFSRRLNIIHRLVYEVDENKKTVKIIRMWTHYE